MDMRPPLAWIAFCIALPPWAAACGAVVQPSPERAVAMKPSDTPYNIQVQVWRDEQPGDDPVLHLSVRLDPRKDAVAWSDMALADVRLSVGEDVWRPSQASLEPLPDGAFQLRAQGAPTIEAEAEARVELRLETHEGPKRIVIPQVRANLID